MIPFGSFVLADLPVGLVWFNAVDVLLWALWWLLGWGANSSWSLVGGYRFLALALSYELPLMFALTAPVRQIASNAGHDGAVVAGKLTDGNDESLGFNAATDTYENLVAAGVIDPTKVVRTALQNAASVAGLLITTEAAISDIPEDKSGGGMPDMGGMGGGMGGMGF